ncbi:MAG: RNA polymerase sigma-70 factor [Chitinophagaceae bacterium]
MAAINKFHLLSCMQKISKENDMESFKILYRHYFSKLFRFCISIIHSKESAEEIVNDVFINLWENKDRLHKIENPEVYLYVAVKNQSIAYLKKSRSRETVDISTISSNYLIFNIDPEQLMITEEMKRKIRHTIDQLPPRCKHIFSLIKEDGLKYKEVASILNLSVKTVESQMAIAMKRLITAILPNTRESVIKLSNRNYK